jgi:hypothetical protein
MKMPGTDDSWFPVAPHTAVRIEETFGNRILTRTPGRSVRFATLIEP